MIEYETLCQHIVDWREGKKPGAPPPLPGGVAAAPEPEPAYEAYEEVQPEPMYEEVQPELQHEAEAAVTHEELQTTGYEELDTTMEDALAQSAPELPDEFAEGPADRTQAYIPEDYDPANVAGQVAELEQQADAVVAEAADMEPLEDVAVEAEAEELDVDTSDAEEIDIADDDDEAGGDDFERDYDLEEIDDYASFDPYTDLSAFFKAELHITSVWEDDDQRRAALAQYGIRDEQHFYQVTSSMERYFISDDAEQRYGGLDGIMQLKMNATTDAVREEQQARIEGELASDFEPVHGISLQQWAAAQAQIASGADAGPIVEGLGIDDATWQAVSAEWNDRMARDTTATIATEYGKAFSAGGAGQFAAAGADAAAAMDAGADPTGDPPISIEQWVEIEVAQSVGYEQGREAADVLAQFGMTPADWGIAGGWWSQYFSRHAMENDGALHKHYSQLREHYEAHYRGTAG
ncbi:MAG: hypothetical protein AAGA54_12255 [Myxococcota bacterium]